MVPVHMAEKHMGFNDTFRPLLEVLSQSAQTGPCVTDDERIFRSNFHARRISPETPSSPSWCGDGASYAPESYEHGHCPDSLKTNTTSPIWSWSPS